MNRKGLLLIGVSAAGIVFGLTLVPGTPIVEMISGAERETARRQAATAAPAIEPTDMTAVTRAGATAGMDEVGVDRLVASGYIPAEYRELWLDPDVDRIIQERFEVIPRADLAAGETCHPVEFDGGHLCWNTYGHHPYLAYDLEVLRQMAETDAAAAEALALRLPHRKRRERLHYALLAAQLSGKPGPVMRFAYSFTPDRDSPAYGDQLLDRYAIALTAEAMGFPYRFSRELENHILRDLKLSRDELDVAMVGRRVTLSREMGGGS